MMEATAWIALVALGFTGTQAWMAHRKLRFDLFAKRYEAWEALNDQINAKIDKLPSSDHAIIRTLDLGADHIYDDEQRDILQKIYRLQRQMQFMFPPEVSENIDNVMQAISVRDAAAMKLSELQKDTEDENSQEVSKAKDLLAAKNKIIESEQSRLASCVHRYVHLYGWTDIVGSAVRGSYLIWRNERTKRK